MSTAKGQARFSGIRRECPVSKTIQDVFTKKSDSQIVEQFLSPFQCEIASLPLYFEAFSLLSHTKVCVKAIL